MQTRARISNQRLPWRRATRDAAAHLARCTVRLDRKRPPRHVGPRPPGSLARREICCSATLGHHTTADILTLPPIRWPRRTTRRHRSPREHCASAAGAVERRQRPPPGEHGEIFCTSGGPLPRHLRHRTVRWLALDTSARPSLAADAPSPQTGRAAPDRGGPSAAYHTSAHFTGVFRPRCCSFHSSRMRAKQAVLCGCDAPKP